SPSSSWCARCSAMTVRATRWCAPCASVPDLVVWRWALSSWRKVGSARGVVARIPGQTQGCRVHAVPLAGGLGSVGEHVPEVGPAAPAHDLVAHHAVADVSAGLDRALAHGLGEAGPARARVVLRLRREQRLAAHDAMIGAVIVAVPVLAG